MTWREGLVEAMAITGDTMADIVSSTMTDAEMDAEFDGGWGRTEGTPFTIWTANHVYFPASYDGREWVSSVSRHPNGKPTRHIGGG